MRLWCMAACIAAAGGTPAFAVSWEEGLLSSWDTYFICRKDLKLSFGECSAAAAYADPIGDGVTAISQTVDYNEALFTFNAARSGVIGVFADGGFAPAADPGVGTEPLQLYEAPFDYALGAALPGWELSVVDDGSSVSVSYTMIDGLGAPLVLTGDENWFVFWFDFVTPMMVDLSASTVTYHESGPGDFVSTTSFSCTLDAGGSCGSPAGSSGVSLSLAPIPAPPAAGLLAAAALGLGVFRRRG